MARRATKQKQWELELLERRAVVRALVRSGDVRQDDEGALIIPVEMLCQLWQFSPDWVEQAVIEALAHEGLLPPPLVH